MNENLEVNKNYTKEALIDSPKILEINGDNS